MTREIPLTRGFVALVDDDDFDQLNQWKWSVSTRSSGIAYAVRRLPRTRKMISMHRELVGAGPGETVDHANRDGCDNRRANLRICTVSQNNMNRQRKYRAASGYRGVLCPDPARREHLFTAKIGVNGKTVRLGSAPTAAEAAALYDDGARRYHGEFAVLNFPSRAA